MDILNDIFLKLNPKELSKHLVSYCRLYTHPYDTWKKASSNSSSPLTDEAWGKQVSEGKAPQRPVWIDDITIRTKSLESKVGYSF